MGFSFGDLFQFEKMVAPVVLKVVYWLGLAGIVIMMLIGIAGGLGTMSWNVATGLGTILISILSAGFGVLMWRVMIEVYMVLFGIHQRLGEVRDALKGDADKPAE